MSDNYLPLDKSWLSFEQVKNLLQFEQQLLISLTAEEEIVKCRHYLDDKLKGPDELFYGINTGFGFLQNVRINKDELQQLQQNLLQSHACGMGEEVPVEIVKLMLMLKIKSL